MKLKSIAYKGFFALLIITSLEANAQDQRFRVGMKFSGNLSWFSPVSKNIDRVGTTLGYSYGLMGDYNFQKYYALSAELLFTEIGGSMQHRDLLMSKNDSSTVKNHSDVRYDYRLKYVQLPISIKFKTKEFGYWTYWAQFGTSPSFLTTAIADISGKTVESAFDDPTNIRVNKKENDDYHFTNFEDKVFLLRMPLMIGAGVEYKLAGNTSLYGGIRVDNDFINTFNADDATNAKSRFVSLNVGVFF